MDEATWYALKQEAEDVAMATLDHQPTRESWGIESYGDAPAGIGGGIGGFLWFADRKSALDFLGRLLVFLSPGPSNLDHGAVANEAAAIVERIANEGLTVDAGLDELNRALRSFSQVRWFGRFTELLEGDRPFEREIRVWARSDEDDGEPVSSPILAAELDDFHTTVREWGV